MLHEPLRTQDPDGQCRDEGPDHPANARSRCVPVAAPRQEPFERSFELGHALAVLPEILMDAVEPLLHFGRDAVDPLVGLVDPLVGLVDSLVGLVDPPPKSVFSSLMRFPPACNSLVTFVVRMRSIAPRAPMTPMPVPMMDRTIIAVAVMVSPRYHDRPPAAPGGAWWRRGRPTHRRSRPVPWRGGRMGELAAGCSGLSQRAGGRLQSEDVCALDARERVARIDHDRRTPGDLRVVDAAMIRDDHRAVDSAREGLLGGYRL